MRTSRRLLVPAAVALMAVAGCQSAPSGAERNPSASGSPAQEESADSQGVTVTDASVRVPANPDVTAGYLTITNNAGSHDTLVAVRSEAAEEVQMHDTMHEGGAMKMQRQEEVPVPAGETVAFESGGLHLMLMKPEELNEGDTVGLRLEFAEAGPVAVRAEVVAAGG